VISQRYSLASAPKVSAGSASSNSSAMPVAKCRTTRADVLPIVTGEPIGGAASTWSAAPSIERSINAAGYWRPSGVVKVARLPKGLVRRSLRAVVDEPRENLLQLLAL
jgi:hypothetical protein